MFIVWIVKCYQNLYIYTQCFLKDECVFNADFQHLKTSFGGFNS